MAKITKTIESGDHKGRAVTFDFDLGEHIQDPSERLQYLVDTYGAGVVLSMAVQKLTIAAQSRAGQLIKSGKSDEEIQAAMLTYKPTQAKSGGRKKKTDAEEFAAIVARMKEQGKSNKEVLHWVSSVMSGETKLNE